MYLYTVFIKVYHISVSLKSNLEQKRVYLGDCIEYGWEQRVHGETARLR